MICTPHIIFIEYFINIIVFGKSNSKVLHSPSIVEKYKRMALMKLLDLKL